MTSKYLLIIIFGLFCGLYRVSSSESNVETKFREENIVPDILDAVPNELLKISYPSGVSVNLGNVLTPTQVQNQPTVEWNTDDGSYYTLLMTDPDAPSREKPTAREFRHWLIVNIRGNDLSTGEVKWQFIGSGPPKGTKLHRYVFLLFKQTNGKQDFNDLPTVANNSRKGRPSSSTRDLITNYNLQPVAGNFYQAEYDKYVPKLHAQLTEN